ncbi:histone-lysine N-methyltransferase SETMAR [Elysia marginata]|uniref:Histone-lysine N-methyltransferase SETMAR n=1 Tax=Elysia marginata TaxID=1093978 RepID=A0AAV4IES9_9GAST|nr:histone-lysine N-methyltransferase SETMAR [Elysia marginata]
MCGNSEYMCGDSEYMCGNIEYMCGNSEYICGNSECMCGNSEYMCGNMSICVVTVNAHMCGDSEYMYGNSEYMCGNSECMCGNSEYMCGNSECMCGNSEYMCDNSECMCGNSEYMCGYSEYMCGNSECMCGITLDRLRDSIHRKRPGLLRRGVVLQQDNATPHKANLTQQSLQRYGWEILPHPAHSPYLAPSDFLSFGPLKRHLGGMAFETEGDLVDDYQPNPSQLSPDDVIRAGNPLEVYCCADLVGVDSSINVITELRIERRFGGYSKQFASYYTKSHKEGALPPSKKTLHGRDWEFEFPAGGGLGIRETIIKWTLKDARKEDAGHYVCHVEFYVGRHIASHEGEQHIPYLANLRVTNPRSLSPDKFLRVGSHLEIACNADLVGVPPAVTNITCLELSRYTNHTSSAVMLIAGFYPYATFFLTRRTQIPEGRDWYIETSGERRPFISTSRTMNIKLTIRDATPADAGIYQCEVKYGIKGVQLSLAGQQVVPFQAKLRSTRRCVLHPGVSMGAENQVHINCSADIAGVPSAVTNIHSLHVTRQTTLDRAPATLVASYNPFSSFFRKQVTEVRFRRSLCVLCFTVYTTINV